MSCASLIRLVPTGLALLVGLVSLRMAVKGLSAREWLPFHAAVAGTGWDSLSPRLRTLVLFLVRLGGLGFLLQFLLLATLPLYFAWHPDLAVRLVVLCGAMAYCIGLGILTHRVHRETGAGTPWRESFGAAGLLAPAAVLSVVTR
jgi:hypothetical protein